jgi:hypothetical protein
MEAGGNLDMVIERCRPWIEAALEYSGGTHLFEDIDAGIKSGRFQLWPAERGCLVTEILVFPRKKVLNVFLGGGDLEQLVDMHDAVAAWGVQQGCTSATINGRPGWKRVYASRGWKPIFTTLGKDLT